MGSSHDAVLHAGITLSPHIHTHNDNNSNNKNTNNDDESLAHSLCNPYRANVRFQP
jgi:hypothetical protein